ncbi:multidrug effflux MFS transporter, partial [Streptomyces sp. S1A]|uniref:multidrug effflux MFS transporter n=1 Tax=Streptomyces sp. ICN903 TaxID=2964654 RepID=UPI001EDB1E0C
MPPMSSRPLPTPLLTAALALLSFVVPLGTDMYLPAFPRMADDLGTDASGVQLTLTAFLVGLAAGQLVLGPVSDRFGRRGPILLGSAVCTVATALCAVAPTTEWLIALRFVTGFSGAAGIVVGRAVVSDVAEGGAAARLFGILMALGGLAPIVAPLLGGAVAGAFGWRGVFWALAAASALMFLGALIAVPETLPENGRRTAGLPAALGAAGAVLANRHYLGHTLAFVFGSGSLFCYIAASPFLFQEVLGMDMRQMSMAFSAGALTATLSSAANARLVSRFRPARLLVAGLAAMAVPMGAAMAAALTGRLGTPLVLVLLTVNFLGLGLVFANATALAIGCVPRAAGTGSAVLGTLQSAVGAAVAPLMGLGDQGTAVPLLAGMTAGPCAALLSLLLTRGREEEGS